MARTLTAVNLMFALCLSAVFLSSDALAKDCGAEPINPPAIPDGEKVNRDQIVAARQSIIAYSEQVDTYLNCMDQRLIKLRSYMSKEAMQRWQEDSTKLSNQRTELQIAINKAIRAYRRRREAENNS